MRIRILVGAVVVAITVALSAGQALAQPEFDMVLAKQKGGPYFGKNENVADNTVVSANIGVGDTKTFYIKVKNIGTHDNPDAVELRGSANPLGWVLKWFKKDQNITTDVQGAGYDFAVKEGRSKVFRMKVKAGAGNACPTTSMWPGALFEQDRIGVSANGGCAP